MARRHRYKSVVRGASMISKGTEVRAYMQLMIGGDKLAMRQRSCCQGHLEHTPQPQHRRNKPHC